MAESPGVIEVDLFSEEVDEPNHPEVLRFRALLEDVADEYGCSLVSFELHKGTISFSFDDDAVTGKILKLLRDDDLCQC
jgi:hypothetical protein